MKTTQHKRVMSSTKRNHRDEDLVTSLAAHLFDNQKHLVGESQDKWEQYAREWLESSEPRTDFEEKFYGVIEDIYHENKDAVAGWVNDYHKKRRCEECQRLGEEKSKEDEKEDKPKPSGPNLFQLQNLQAGMAMGFFH